VESKYSIFLPVFYYNGPVYSEFKDTKVDGHYVTLHDLNSDFRYMFWKDLDKNIHVIQYFCDLVQVFD
jgi:hypothetical protein